MPTMIASIETTSRYRSSPRCSKRVMVPSGGAGGGLSHFKLKWMGRPLIVKDTAAQGVLLELRASACARSSFKRLGVVAQVGTRGILVGPRRLLVGGTARRLR